MIRKLLKIKSSYLLAAAIVVVLTAWISTGDVVVGGRADSEAKNGDTQTPAEQTAEAEKEPFRVAVRTFKAEEMAASLVVRGRTEAAQRVRVKAETAGRILALPLAKGARVAAGDVVCRLDAGAREARVLQARAQLAQAELNFEAADQLSAKGYAAETRVRAARASLDAAKAALAEAELDLARTEIRAPFGGIIETEEAKTGDYLNIGNPCVTITALDPLLAVGQVSERDVAALHLGMTGTITLVTGEKVEGRVRFVSPAADPATRTFRIELEVANAQGALRDGVTARIEVPLPSTRAHRLSPAILSLDDAGNIGVKTVGADAIARFQKVTIVGDVGGHVWVTGLPDEVTLIVTGQDYIADGEKVLPVPAEGGAV